MAYNSFKITSSGNMKDDSRKKKSNLAGKWISHVKIYF